MNALGKARQFFADADPAAIAAVIATWAHEAPSDTLFALVAEADRDVTSQLQAAARAHGVGLAGAIFPALIAGDAFSRRGVWLVRMHPSVRHCLIGGLAIKPDDAAVRIVEALSPLLSDAQDTLFMVFDAMLPSIASTLDALYLNLADAARYLGVNAGSETFQPMPCLFDEHRLVSDGVLCLLLPKMLETALAHGYVAPEQAITATSTEGNRINSIDWRPAFEVYSEKVQAAYGVSLTPDNFYQYAVHFPFGISLANGQTLVRIPVALEADGSIFCVGEVPTNAVLTLLQSPQADELDTVRQLAGQFSAAASASPEALLFYCAGRHMHLGEAAGRELQAFARTASAQLVGALSLGEIGSEADWAYPLFHNAALVCAR